MADDSDREGLIPEETENNDITVVSGEGVADAYGDAGEASDDSKWSVLDPFVIFSSVHAK